MILAAAIAAALAQQAPLFAPPLGQPLRVTSERTEGEGEARSVFRIERLVRFTREGGGYRVEVRLVARGAEASPKAQGMFDAGYAGLAGRTLAFRADAAGKVTALDDLAGHWEAFCGGMRAMVATRRGKVPEAEYRMLLDRVAEPICALPHERRFTTLATLVAPLVAEEAADPPGERPVHLTAASPFGGPLTLDGTRTIAPQDLLVRSTTRAAADASGTDSAAGRVEIERDRLLDPLTGLLVRATETVRTTADGRTTTRVTVFRVRLEPPAVWDQVF